MIPGKSYPKPNGKVWVSAYTDSRKEYFEIRTADPEDSEKTRPQWHYECTLGTGLADFAYEDLSWLRKHFEKVREHADGEGAKTPWYTSAASLMWPCSGSTRARCLPPLPQLWRGCRLSPVWKRPRP